MNKIIKKIIACSLVASTVLVGGGIALNTPTEAAIRTKTYKVCSHTTLKISLDDYQTEVGKTNIAGTLQFTSLKNGQRHVHGDYYFTQIKNGKLLEEGRCGEINNYLVSKKNPQTTTYYNTITQKNKTTSHADTYYHVSNTKRKQTTYKHYNCSACKLNYDVAKNKVTVKTSCCGTTKSYKLY